MKNKFAAGVVVLFMMVFISPAKPAPKALNGFDLSNASIPVSEVFSGGPPRDGIPSIDAPKFIRSDAVRFMQADDEVVSVTRAGQTRAYPLRILVHHEIVNDELSGQPIAITYCPLCGTAMVFSRQLDGRTLDFEVSGLLYQSDVLMFDQQTESLWSQVAMQAVSGSLMNTALEWLPSEQMTWAAWRAKYPQGEVLSTQTGFRRDYSDEAYARYKQSPNTMFPVPSHRTELPEKEWVIGVLVDGEAKAYPLKALSRNPIVQDTVNNVSLEIIYDPFTRLAVVREILSGKIRPSVKVYWFAWQAFYPTTELFDTKSKKNCKERAWSATTCQRGENHDKTT